MKKVLMVLLGIVVAAIIGIILVFHLTRGMVDTADAFFKAVKQNDMAKARSYLAEDFKANTDEAALREFLSKSALINFKETSWSERQISGNRGELDGSIATESGGTVPVKLVFVKEGGEWKIYSLQKPTAGLVSQESSDVAPPKAEQIVLVKRSMHDFGISIRDKNMEHFRGTVSNLWQQQHTTEKLNEAYDKIIEAELDLTVLDSFDPVLDEPAQVDENGVLTLKGHYATQPDQVYFTQKFIHEGVGWKLLGFHIRVE